MAHLNLGLLAYWIVNTVRYQLRQKDFHTQWIDIVRTMNTRKLVITTLDNEYGQRITIRQCSEPIAEATAIYAAMGYKPKPFSLKKSVVPLHEIKKNHPPDNQKVNDH